MKSRFRVIEGGNVFQDIEALRIRDDDDEIEEAPQPVEAKEEAWQRGTFAMVPKLWFDRLKEINASGDLCRLAWILLYRANLKRRFSVNSTILWEAGVQRQHKRALLEKLEAAGLVRVEWQPAPRVPQVTVLHLVGRRSTRK